jgi:hypothetical protein
MPYVEIKCPKCGSGNCVPFVDDLCDCFDCGNKFNVNEKAAQVQPELPNIKLWFVVAAILFVVGWGTIGYVVAHFLAKVW